MAKTATKKPIRIDFNPDLFNDIYWHLDKDFDNPLIRFIFLLGGSSASKTFTVVQKVVVSMLANQENTLVLRKFGTDIKDSIFADFKGVIDDWGLAHLFTIQQNFIKCKVTGSYIRFRGLDDSEKVKGITKFKRVIMEEISQFDEVDFKQLRKRLRGMSGQQIIGIFNPISETHWLKVNLFDTLGLQDVHVTEHTNITSKQASPTGHFVVYKVTYLNNRYIVGPHFVDQHAIDDFEHDRVHDYAYYQIYGLGNWGKIRTGGEYWKDFDANRHQVDNPIIAGKLKLFNPEKPIHISWDKNVQPYVTCLLWQVAGEYLTQFDEICLPDPRNRVRHVLAEFKKRYPVATVKGLFVYGDKTAEAEDSTKEKGQNFFSEIIKGLQEYHPRKRLPSTNPSVVQSGNFVNEIYAERIPGVKIRIGSNCSKSLYDYSYALEDAEGGISKKKITNKATGISYEEFGHCSDAKRYFITMVKSSEYDVYRVGRKGKGSRTGKAVSRNNA